MKTLARILASPTRVAMLLGLTCTALVGASFFIQHVLRIDPCPLCIVQRFTYVGLIPVFLGAAMLRDNAPAQRTLIWTAGVLTLGGLGVAGYQTYLQLFPAPLAVRCSASLYYMLENMALTEVLDRVLNATGDAAYSGEDDRGFRLKVTADSA